MKEININNANLNFINEMSNNAVLSVGTKDSYNMMTIGWALEGILWKKKIIMVFVKPIRYTNIFMKKEEYFALNFFNARYQKEVDLLGTVSGRDFDKTDLVGFHLLDLDKTVAFKEADKIIILKKIYDDTFKKDKLLKEVIDKYYESEDCHDIYIGEIIKIIDLA